MSLCKERAWEMLTKLSFERVTGTEAELKAANMIKEECDKIGVEAHLEAYEIDQPTITEVSFAVTKPEYKEYHVIGVANSGNTPDEGLTAPFAYVENALDVNLANVKGKIVLVTGRLMPNQMKKLKDAGVVATIQTHGSFYDAADLVPELRPRSARGKDNVPGVVMHINDAEALVRSHPEEVKIVLKGDGDHKGEAHNVVATIEGTDPVLKNEVLAFSAHYDSVPYSPGAWDNMTGSITIMELMHYFKENPPKRTVKFVWCGSEEIGLVGSRKFCEAHKEELENYIFNINFDMTGVTLGYEHFCCTASDEVLHALQYAAKLENYAVNTVMDFYASDSSSFANAGVPACTFARLQCPGGAVIHNHNDTMDHLDPDSFMITLEFVAKWSNQIANAPVNVIPRKFSDVILKKKEERAKFFPQPEPKKEEKKEEVKPEEKKEETK